IAEEAGLNLALLNYYFRSKEKLFEIVMMEKTQKLFGIIFPILNDPDTSIQNKLETITNLYLEMLRENPDLPLFVLSEIRTHPKQFGNKMQAGKIIRESVLVKQLAEKRPDLPPVHFLMNLLGMVLFPFIARPVFINVAGEEEFERLMESRKKMIPVWI